MITYQLKKNTVLYHGTVSDFEPNELKLPSWLSFDKEQSHNHICYKYFGNSNGKILKYITNNIIKLIDLSKDGNSRLYVNAYGNYSFAENIKNGEYGDDIHGYINYPEQAEVMICQPYLLNYLKSEKVSLNNKVEYKRITKVDWRMKKDKNFSFCTIQ